MASCQWSQPVATAAMAAVAFSSDSLAAALLPLKAPTSSVTCLKHRRQVQLFSAAPPSLRSVSQHQTVNDRWGREKDILYFLVPKPDPTGFEEISHTPSHFKNK